ncbi:MAG: hypothetical protein M5U15_14330 [Kiritimatiellae bacterium]|nr:hypothetical protein [Kiritimatiellia bacterium]
MFRLACHQRLFAGISFIISTLALIFMLGCDHSNDVDQFRAYIESSATYEHLILERNEYSGASRIANAFRKEKHYRYSLWGEVDRSVDYRILVEIIYRMGLEDVVRLNVSLRGTPMHQGEAPISDLRGAEAPIDRLIDFIEDNKEYTMLILEKLEYPKDIELKQAFKMGGVYPLWDYILAGSVRLSQDLNSLIDHVYALGLYDRVVIEVDVREVK